MSEKLKIREAAAAYAVKPFTFYKWVQRGIVPASCLVRIGGAVRVDSGLLSEAIARGECRIPRHRKEAPLLASTGLIAMVAAAAMQEAS